MTVSLIDHLKTVTDFRSARGRRYPLWVVLLLLLLGIMSECQGYCALETVARRHKAALIQALGLPLTRLPSDSTFRLILQRLDETERMQVFNQWARQSLELEPGSGWSIDGKSIAGTLSEHQGSAPNFVAIVSVSSQQQGCVLQMSAFENQAESEWSVVQQLLGALHLQEGVLTLDALHAQKRTIAAVLNRGNDCLIGLKANQPTLLNQCLLMRLEALPDSTWQAAEHTRDRPFQRMVRVDDCTHPMSEAWAGVRRVICVDQVGTRQGQPYHQRRWLISALITSAEGFARRMRAHWGIENPLHWVKDVVFGEDQAPFTQINAAINWAIGRTFVINRLRQQGWWSMTQALQEIAHDIPQLLHLTQ